MLEVPHTKARHSAACHAIAKNAPLQSGWEVETDADFSQITSEQMRERLERTEHPIGLTFQEDDSDIHIRSVELPEEMRGMGVGTQLYMEALKYAQQNSLGFRSDIGPTPDALAVYSRLIKAGLPITQQRVSLEEGEAIQVLISVDDLQEIDLDELAQSIGNQDG
jgi:predicted GNAT family acetyltransferase